MHSFIIKDIKVTMYRWAGNYDNVLQNNCKMQNKIICLAIVRCSESVRVQTDWLQLWCQHNNSQEWRLESGESMSIQSRPRPSSDPASWQLSSGIVLKMFFLLFSECKYKTWGNSAGDEAADREDTKHGQHTHPNISLYNNIKTHTKNANVFSDPRRQASNQQGLFSF